MQDIVVRREKDALDKNFVIKNRSKYGELLIINTKIIMINAKEKGTN